MATTLELCLSTTRLGKQHAITFWQQSAYSCQIKTDKESCCSWTGEHKGQAESSSAQKLKLLQMVKQMRIQLCIVHKEMQNKHAQDITSEELVEQEQDLQQLGEFAGGIVSRRRDS